MGQNQGRNERVAGPWEKELDDFAHAFGGAFLFGMPLLFTMEMWWIGEFLESWKLLAFLALAFLANIVLAYFAGFKEGTTFGANVTQAVESMAVGAVAATAVLGVLNQIQLGDPINGVVGKIALQTVPLSIGASAANALLSGWGGNQQNGGSKRSAGPVKRILQDLGKTVAGGLFIGFNIAPTEEVPMLATELSYGHKLALIGLALVITYVIVFESGFSPQHRANGNSGESGGNMARGPFQRPISETAMAYIVSLVVALTVLFLFDQVKVGDTLNSVLSEVLVLGVPTAIGGAAGRALI